MKNYLPLLILLFNFSFSNAAIVYVTASGAGSQNGTSWQNAYSGSQLQLAINLSNNGDEVWVATGTFVPTSTTSRTVSFSLKQGVTLYGSFTGTETTLAQRNIYNGLTTVLSGEIGTPGVSDNSYHVISNFNISNSGTIDGFIIKDGNDNRASNLTDGFAGGIYNNASNSGTCSPTIRNCLITNNRASYGAGIFNNAYNNGTCNPNIINCVITDNHASNGGGGIDNFAIQGGVSSPTLINTIIYKNTAVQRAGGMYCWGGNNGASNPFVYNCVFFENITGNGGAIVCDNTNTSSGNSGSSFVTVINSIMFGNTATLTAGPQFYCLGTASLTASNSDIDLTGQTSPHVITTPLNNTNTNPLFVNATLGEGADGKWFTQDDGFALQATSTLINAGSTTAFYQTDIVGNPRIVGLNADIGAYEFYMVNTSVIKNNTNTILIFPNPTNNKIYVKGISDLNKVKLTNSIGIELPLTIENENSLNFLNYPKGIYFINVDSKIYKVIKQ